MFHVIVNTDDFAKPAGIYNDTENVLWEVRT
jgi:hypothetical protein